jgi:hypothetical protein
VNASRAAVALGSPPERDVLSEKLDGGHESVHIGQIVAVEEQENHSFGCSFVDV